jgi:hypothetical protein
MTVFAPDTRKRIANHVIDHSETAIQIIRGVLIRFGLARKLEDLNRKKRS